MAEGHGGQFVTLYEAEKMMTEMLKVYEKETVEPRHRETQSELADIKEIASEGRGMMRLAGWIGSIAGVVWIVVQLKGALSH